MILQALKEYYDRKAADSDSNIAPPGWEWKEIPYIIVLNKDGQPVNMFEHDHSAARGEMSTVKLVVFKHDSYLGNTLSKDLFQRVKITKIDANKPARSTSDYEITVEKDGLPQGVEVIEKP
ncbi:MAG: type I CRISPR-associated protein Cas7 [Planctomycetaceae bacterium]|jgi:hypothetical protein|nr:type I CRISPR-associated protein Cas7 [Planctomycetaceae bacterium]